MGKPPATDSFSSGQLGGAVSSNTQVVNYTEQSPVINSLAGRRTCTHSYGQVEGQAEMGERPSSWKYCYGMQEYWEVAEAMNYLEHEAKL